MAGGRVRMTLPLLVDWFASSVPCFLLIVYQMDKVELRFHMKKMHSGLLPQVNAEKVFDGQSGYLVLSC